MDATLVSTSLSVAGVAVSTVVAYVVGRRQAIAQLDAVRLELAAKYTDKLYERRLALYPDLHRITSELGGDIRSGRLQVERLQFAWNQIRDWDAKHSLVMSAVSMQKLIELRRLILALMDSSDEYVSNNRAKDHLLPSLIELEMALKTELGIFHADGYHAPSKIVHLRESLNAVGYEDPTRPLLKPRRAPR